MQRPALVIMAAGLGSRYGGLKQAEPVGPHGELIIDYSIHDAMKAGFGRVICIIKPENREIFEERIGRRHSEAKIEYAGGVYHPRGAAEAVGHRPCGAVLRRDAQGALCGHQCGRLLRAGAL